MKHRTIPPPPNACVMGKEKYSPANVTCVSCHSQLVTCPFPFAVPESPVKNDSPQPSKYRNHIIEADGIRWDSKKEYACWQRLKMQEKAGLIRDLRRQVAFKLAPAVMLNGRNKPPLKFTADFCYVDCTTGGEVIADAKSPATRKETAFRMRLHLLKAVYGYDVVEM